MLTLHSVSYLHANKEMLFDNINWTVNQKNKTALIGNNGIGKSTLLRIVANELIPFSGTITVNSKPFYVPQVFGQFNHLTIAEALKVNEKLSALQQILQGKLTETNISVLDDDWTIEDRCKQAMNTWQLPDLDLSQKMESLSGGQKTKVLLAGISVHDPEFILLDEPSNHLDLDGRELLYDFIRSTQSTIVIASHDRKLLNLVNTISELSEQGITVYGGNYEFYKVQKEIQTRALMEDIQSSEKALRKAKEKERETLERQQRLDARGKKKQEKAGVARIMMNTLRNNAEMSTSKVKQVHHEKIDGIARELKGLRASLPDMDKVKFGLDDSALHKGKVLVNGSNINFSYKNGLLWKQNLEIKILTGDRIALKGSNGAGKTTLIKLILGQLVAETGTVYRADYKSIFIDQDYSLIDNRLTVYQQANSFNASALQEHDIKIRLNRFLFTKDDWHKPCGVLSGGEKMRLLLCCLTIDNAAPDMIILDEPTNNLDIQSIEILVRAVKDYKGTLIVVSHDSDLLDQLKVDREIVLGRNKN